MSVNTGILLPQGCDTKTGIDNRKENSSPENIRIIMITVNQPVVNYLLIIEISQNEKKNVMTLLTAVASSLS